MSHEYSWLVKKQLVVFANRSRVHMYTQCISICVAVPNV